MSVARPSRRALSSPLLRYTPPELVSPRLVTITENPATRIIYLNAGEDCMITSPTPIRYVKPGFAIETDAMVTVVGGRNVVWVGAHFIGEESPITTVTEAIDADGLTLTVASTADFPDAGWLRVDGEGIRYTSKTATSFVIAERRFGFYLGDETLPNTPHSVGARVYLGEYSRSAVSFRSQTGFVHAEGFLCEGFLNDGIRVRGTSATTVTLQNMRIGPVTCHEKVNMEDGHPDCIQTWGSGVKALRMSHMTLMAGKSGRSIINAANTSGGGAVERIEVYDTEMIDAENVANTLVTNSTPTTTWQIGNTWLRTTKPRTTASPDGALASQFDVGNVVSPGRDFVPRETVGLGYVSPGYRA